MQIESQILGIINDKLKNPIYQTIQLLNMKTILTKSNFTKKDGVAVHMGNMTSQRGVRGLVL